MVHRLQHTIDRALFKLTKQKQPTKALYITISCLSIGILFVLYNAFGARIPSPHDNNLRRDRDNDDFNIHEDVMADAKFNPYSFASSSSNNNKSSKNRLAIIIPYLPPNDGGTFPPYFDLFAQSAAGSSQDVDYLIFHCFIPQSLLPNVDSLPANVKLIDLNEPISDSDGRSEGSKNQCGLAKLFTRVTDERQSNNELVVPISQLITRLSHQIINLPYILVEYKPAFGHIFSSYLKEYTHWGYSDLDVVYGDISRWIDVDEWYNYDIVTYGFGDQDKLYLRGQFTFHRNDYKYINQLWRHCKYLSEMDIRYSKNTKNIKFESAEGCYSQAVIQKKDIKVKWAVKAFTDVGENSPIYTHGVYLSLGSKPSLTTSRSYHPKSVLYTAADTKSGHALQSLPYNWFEDKTNYPKYIEENLPIQKLVGERTKVQTYRTLYNQGELTKEDADKVKCMYWAPKTYQLDICTVNGNVASDEVVVLEKGVLYKQKYVVRKKLFPEGIRSFPFFHFQEWKRIYRTTELLPSHNIRDSNTLSGLIITKEGALPLMIQSSASSRWNFHLSQSDAWQTADTGSTLTHSSNTKFCLNSSPKGYPKGATTCNLAVSWPQPSVDTYTSTTSFGESASVTVLRSPGETDYLNSKTTTVRGRLKRKHKPSWWNEKLIDANNDVTLTLTLQITPAHMKEKALVQSLLAVADSNIYVWGSHQPSVLLIQVDSSNDEETVYFTQTIQMIKSSFGISSSDQSSPNTSHLKNCLVAIVDSSYEESSAVSRKALLNMATHVAPTRWIVSGLELERGLILSREASIYALREARVYTDMPGHVLVVPQFASTRDDTRKDASHVTPKDRLIYSSIGAELLPSIRGKQTMVTTLSEYDCIQCSVEEEEEEDIDPQGAEEEEVDDGLDDGANRRRLSDGISAEKNVEELLEDLWWDLSVADVYGTPGGFNGEARTSVGAMAKIHGNIEMSLISLLDRSKSDHVEYLKYFDKSPILLIDRLGPKKEMMTLDLASEVEEFSGSKCFNLLRLAQLATLGYKVSVLPGVFAASYPNTRDALCTKSFQDNSPPQQCECDLDSEDTIKEILIDEVKRLAKVAVLTNELDIVQATV